MPKVYLSEEQKLSERLTRWIYGEMRLKNMSQYKLADELGISQPALSKKLRSRSFSYKDFIVFVRVFKPDAEEVMRLLGA